MLRRMCEHSHFRTICYAQVMLDRVSSLRLYREIRSGRRSSSSSTYSNSFCRCKTFRAKTKSLSILLHHRCQGVIRICLSSVSYHLTKPGMTYHRLDVRVRYSIKLVVLKFELGPNIDIRSLVLGGVTVSRCGEDCKKVSLVPCNRS